MRLTDTFFATLALKNRKLTPEAIEGARRVQEERAARGSDVALGELCLELGLLDAQALAAFADAQRESMRRLEDALCAEIALLDGLVSPERLALAEAERARRGEGARLSQVLVQGGDLTPEAIDAILARARPKDLRPTIAPAARKRGSRRLRRDIDARPSSEERVLGEGTAPAPAASALPSRPAPKPKAASAKKATGKSARAKKR